MLELASKTLGLTTDEIQGAIDIKFLQNLIKRSDDQDTDHTRRSLAVTQVKVDYVITVAVNDNTAIGDVNAIKVHSFTCVRRAAPL